MEIYCREDGTHALTVSVRLREEEKKQNIKVIIFIQENNCLSKIYVINLVNYIDYSLFVLLNNYLYNYVRYFCNYLNYEYNHTLNI